jgi:hypothetical protein
MYDCDGASVEDTGVVGGGAWAQKGAVLDLFSSAGPFLRFLKYPNLVFFSFFTTPRQAPFYFSSFLPPLLFPRANSTELRLS